MQLNLDLVEENLCFPNPCKNNGQCNVKLINFQPTLECVCLEAHYGAYCEFLHDPCRARQCFNGGTCVTMNGTNTAQCNCPQGFYGGMCELDIDECALTSPCPPSFECKNSFGSFECTSCQAGSSCFKSANKEEEASNAVLLTQIESTVEPDEIMPDNKNIETVTISSVSGTITRNESLVAACGLCKNNATCMINDDLEELICICPLGYSGFYCETG